MKGILFITGVCLAFCSMAQTERIVFQAPLLYPEGVTYHPEKDVFFISSVKTGTIGSVDEQGVYKEVYKDAGLKSSFGMKLDATGNRLLVCISDPNYSKYSTTATFKKMARLISVDLASGKKMLDVDLAKLMPGKNFANDLTMDDKGTIYITDSYAGVIYKVDAAGKAAVFAKSSLFKSEDVGLNGILFHPQGYLLAAHTTNGTLLKIDVKNPAKVSVVKMKTLFPGADGLLWAGANNLVLIQNGGVNKAFQLSSTDNWVTAEVKASTATEDRFQYPTTGTVQDSRIWLVNSKLNENTDSSMAPSKEFSLQLAKFQPVQ